MVVQLSLATIAGTYQYSYVANVSNGLGAFFPAGTGAVLNGGVNFSTDTSVAIAAHGTNGFMIIGSKWMSGLLSFETFSTEDDAAKVVGCHHGERRESSAWNGLSLSRAADIGVHDMHAAPGIGGCRAELAQRRPCRLMHLTVWLH